MITVIGGRDKTKKDTYMLSVLLKRFERGEIRDDHPLQRNADMWDNSGRDGLIATIIKGEDIDSIKICEQIKDGEVEQWLIDGKQRLTVSRKYKLNAFRLSKNIEFPIVSYKVAKKDDEGNFMYDHEGKREYEYIEYDLRGKMYKDLPDELKECFDGYAFDVVKHLNCTDEEVAYHMRRYNRQKSLNVAQNAITYSDKIAREIKLLSSNKFFKDCSGLSSTDINNGVVDKVVFETLMVTYFLEDWKKSAKSQGEYLSEHCSKENFEETENNLNRLHKVIDDENAKLFTTKNAFLLISLFNKFKKLSLDDIKYNEFLTHLATDLCNKKVNERSWGEINAEKSSKDKGIVNEKVQILNTLMEEYFKPELEARVNEVKENKESELDFVKAAIEEDVTEEDMEFYDLCLEDYLLEVDSKSKVRDHENRKSLLALVAYTCVKDIDPTKWFASYFNTHMNYLKDQKENFEAMKRDLCTYCSRNVA